MGTVVAMTLDVNGSPASRDVKFNFIDPDNDFLTYTVNSLADAVATVSVSGSVVTVTPIAVGNTTIEVTAQDPGGSSATQNIAVAVISESKPDLLVSSFSAPSKVRAGETFIMNAVVQNLGVGEAASTTLTYYRSTDSTISSSDVSVGSGSVGALAASATSAESLSQIAPGSGTYYYGACVASVSQESDTNNNCSIGVMVDVDDGSPGSGYFIPVRPVFPVCQWEELLHCMPRFATKAPTVQPRQL